MEGWGARHGSNKSSGGGFMTPDLADEVMGLRELLPNPPPYLKKASNSDATQGSQLLVAAMQLIHAVGAKYVLEAQTSSAELAASYEDARKSLAELRERVLKIQDDKARDIAKLKTDFDKIAAERESHYAGEVEVLKRKHDRELELLKHEPAEALSSAKVAHSAELEKAESDRVATVEQACLSVVVEYVGGHRNASRLNFHSSYQLTVFLEVAKVQTVRQSFPNFKFDVSDLLGYSLEPPSYEVPPAGAYILDGDNLLEAWSVKDFPRESKVTPGFEG